MRADARRNHDQILAAARDVFVERGPEAPLEEVARRARVGIGTLYRRFTDRPALLRAVAQEALVATRRAAERRRGAHSRERLLFGAERNSEEAAVNRVYQALAHPVRRQVLSLLREREMTAGELADRFDLAKPTMSGHFGVLREAGLITGERNGTSITYRLNVSLLEEALVALLDMFDVDPKERS